MTSEPAVTIGEFSRMTYLSVKTLRYYHDIGLLAPAEVDAFTGYRRYTLDQVEPALLIRRLRDLDMPVADVQAVLAAPDEAARDATIRAHLTRMEDELARTRSVVSSLRELLTPAPRLSVEYRVVPPQPTLAVSAQVASAEAGAWYDEALARLTRAANTSGLLATGPAGATWAREFFEFELGEVVAFLPVAAHGSPVVGVEQRVLPGGRFAVTVHAGGFDDFDRTYAALGSHVVRHDVPLPDPIREHYVVGPGDLEGADGPGRADGAGGAADPSQWRTEVHWPIRSVA